MESGARSTVSHSGAVGVYTLERAVARLFRLRPRRHVFYAAQVAGCSAVRRCFYEAL